MNKLLFFLVLSLSLFSSNAQNVHVQGKMMMQDGTPFVEIYIYAQGNSISFETQEENFHKGIGCNILLINGADTIKDQFNLVYEGEDSLANFFDIRRYVLDKANYELISHFVDLNNPNDNYTQSQQFLDYTSVEIGKISDLVLLRNFYKNQDHPASRNGVLLEPLAFHDFGASGALLAAYIEFYNSENTTTYIEYGIEDLSNEKILSTYKKVKSEAIDPKILTLDLSEVDPGEYNFFVQSYNDEKVPIARRTDFFKKTSEVSTGPKDVHMSMEETFVGNFSKEELDYYLKTLLPVMPTNRQNLLQDAIGSDDITRKQLFLISFWSTLNKENPGLKFNEYNAQVDYVNERFDYSGQRGYESDRGYMYLKYGPPADVIQIDNEVDAPPYEIWLYNDFDVDEINIKFLFYNPSLVHNDYKLLHGTSRKERQNKNWHKVLYKKAPNQELGPNHHDATRVKDGFGRFAWQYFNDN